MPILFLMSAGIKITSLILILILIVSRAIYNKSVDIQMYSFRFLIKFSLFLLLGSIPGFASVADDANAGLDALARGNLAGAVQMLSKALESGQLHGPDIELAYVKRGQAYIGLGRLSDARRDLQAALKLDPSDREAIALLRQAQPPADANGNQAGPHNLGTAGVWTAATLGPAGNLSCYAYTTYGPAVLTVRRRPEAIYISITGVEGTSVIMSAGEMSAYFPVVAGVAALSDLQGVVVGALKTAHEAVVSLERPGSATRAFVFGLDGFSEMLALMDRGCSRQG